MGIFSVVSIAPEEITTISGAPEERRYFLDIILSQTSKRYLSSLSRYQRVLAQRNNLLKEHRGEEPSARLQEELSGWSQQLAELGCEIISARDRFINHLKIKLPRVYQQMTGSKEEMSVGYVVSGGLRAGDSLPGQLLDKLSRNLRRELILGVTTVGPHRDELEIKVEGNDIRQFGSQGQMRSALLALKLVAADYLCQIKGEPPVVMLDEVFSELDETRTQALLTFVLGEGQVFIATSRRAEVMSIPREYCRFFHVEAGGVKEIGGS